jgi:hypothetical protein
MHSFLNNLISLDERRRTTKLFSLANIFALVPAARTNCPPFPGNNSILCTSVPKGIKSKGKLFPTLISLFLPAIIFEPINKFSGCKI